MRAGLIDEYAIVTYPVLVGGGAPFFTALDNWMNLNLMETQTFPDGVDWSSPDMRPGAKFRRPS
jgi:dihydrofolate reductase